MHLAEAQAIKGEFAEPPVTKERKRFLDRAIPEGFILRSQLLKATGLTEGKLKTLELQGLVKYDKKSTQGWALYNEETVAKIIRLRKTIRKQKTKATEAGFQQARYPAACRKIKASYSPEQGRKAIRMLEKGLNPIQIVTELGLHPTIVYTIIRDYTLIKGGIWIPGDVMETLNKVPLEGIFPITTAEGILELCITASNELLCKKCKVKRRPNQCKGCLGIKPEELSVSSEEPSSTTETTADPLSV